MKKGAGLPYLPPDPQPRPRWFCVSGEAQICQKGLFCATFIVGQPFARLEQKSFVTMELVLFPALPA
jgi:hypothetical protein